MSEHQANLALLGRAETQWQVGKNFHKLPPARKKQTFWSKLVKFFAGK